MKFKLSLSLRIILSFVLLTGVVSGLFTLALRATVDPPSEQVVWYVDGAPYELVDHPNTARWQLTP